MPTGWFLSNDQVKTLTRNHKYYPQLYKKSGYLVLRVDLRVSKVSHISYIPGTRALSDISALALGR